ncbi:MAG TPA: tail fiber domain-containing protein [Candidatus Omnitrophota bacterium]|nr:tail fiber domain-containing protein [Candidatus Omnitrophota bacterium]HPD84567.1 tail fiber domain-containing protein [Candidatus Omnitrophota bacterium]HRZ03425.1 tail fiber domain-containing protein [Candidatus Omnitrophota bacterium]
MKKLFLAVLISTLVTTVTHAQTESMNLTTYYPAPMGNYNQLRLVPRGGAPVTCNNANPDSAGVMWFNQATNSFHICQDDGTGVITWVSIGGVGGGNLWARTGNNLYPANLGDNVGIGTQTPQQKLHIEGAFPILLIRGTGAPALVLDDTDAAGSRPFIKFGGNSLGAFIGQDSWHQTFEFYSDFQLTRAHDAEIRVHGKAPGGSWDRYLSLTHDGTDGYIETDVGDIVINPKETDVAIPEPALSIDAASKNIGIRTSDVTPQATVQIGNNLGFGWAPHALTVGGAGSVGGSVAVGVNSSKMGVFQHSAAGTSTDVSSTDDLRLGAAGSIYQSTAGLNRMKIDTGGSIAMYANDGALTAFQMASTGSMFFQGPASFSQPLSIGNSIDDDVDVSLGEHNTVCWDSKCIRGINSPGGSWLQFGHFVSGAWDTVMSLATAPSTGLGISGSLNISGTATKPGGGPWSASSDARLKKNIASIDNALDTMLSLRGVTFEWREPEKQGNLTGPQMGLIAQEAEKVFPQWVTTGEDGYKILSIRGFEALAIEAMRDMKKEIDQLKQENQELRRELDTLKKVPDGDSPI